VVKGIGSILSISVGFSHACAVRVDGALFCWGDDTDGDLGIDSTYVTTAPAQVPLSHVVQVAAGGSHTCALVRTGVVYCWGDNGYGQLGTGSKAHDSLVPVRVRKLPVAVAIATGENHTCVVLKSGVLQCWGDNVFGQLGDGTTSSSSVPRTVRGLAHVMKVSSGGSHTCALLATGESECWGYGYFGQLGDGREVNTSVPVTVAFK
jgi:alpha-tubulin suppressor-like RCC1 family protein